MCATRANAGGYLTACESRAVSPGEATRAGGCGAGLGGRREGRGAAPGGRAPPRAREMHPQSCGMAVRPVLRSAELTTTWLSKEPSPRGTSRSKAAGLGKKITCFFGFF